MGEGPYGRPGSTSKITQCRCRHKKGVAVGPLAAEMLMDCGNVILAALNFSLEVEI